MLRKVEVPSDVPLIWNWWNAPHVQSNWSMGIRLGALNEEKTDYSELDLQEYLSKQLLPGSKLNPIIALIDGVPVGYIEEYEVGSSPLANHPSLSPEDRGLHLMIGEESFLGQKFPERLGPFIMSWLFRVYPDAMKVVLEPNVKNHRAIHTAMKVSGANRLENVALEHKEAALIFFERPLN